MHLLTSSRKHVTCSMHPPRNADVMMDPENTAKTCRDRGVTKMNSLQPRMINTIVSINDTALFRYEVIWPRNFGSAQVRPYLHTTRYRPTARTRPSRTDIIGTKESAVECFPSKRQQMRMSISERQCGRRVGRESAGWWYLRS
jgi:hypothetical protein